MQDIQLDDKKKAQLDGNIKKMLEGGATEDDIMQYASDFKNQFGQKKNLVSSQSSATPSRLPKISEQVSPLQQGANILGGGVIGDISKTVPKGSIKEAALADKKNNESYLGALWNNVVGSVGRLAGAGMRATYQLSGNPVVRMERELLDKAGKYMGKNLLAEREKELADVGKKQVERLRTSASSKEYEQKLAEGFDVTNGIGIADLKGLGTMAAQFAGDMGLAVASGGGSFALQGYDDALSMVDEVDKDRNMSEGTRIAFGLGGAVIFSVLDKLGLDNLVKTPTAKKYVTAKVIKEATDELVKKGVKVTAEQFENTVKQKASQLTRKEIAKAVGKKATTGFIAEGSTEVGQEVGIDLLKLAANKIENKEIFDEEEMKDTAAKRYLNTLVGAGALGSGGGAISARFQNTESAIKDRLKNVKTVEDIDSIVAEINDNVADGTMTQEEADNVLPIVQNFVDVSQKVPADLIGKNKVEAVDLIGEREKISERLKQIEEQKAALDPAFHNLLDEDAKQLQEREKEINNELIELAKPENNVEEVVAEEEIQQPIENKTRQQLLDERERQIKEIKKKAEGTKEEKDARYNELLTELGDSELAIKKMLEEEKDRAKAEIDKLPPIPKTENEIINEKGESDFVKIKKDLGFKRSSKKWGNSPMDEDMGDALVSEDGNTIVYIKPNEVEIYDEENDSTDDVTNGVRIELVSTKDEARGKGGAKKMIQKIVDWADKNGTDLFLDIAPQDKKTTEEGLKKLYELFGFEFDGIKGVRKPKTIEQPELLEEVRVEQEPELKLNKDNKQPFTTKSKKQIVSFENGDLIVKDAKTGADVSPQTKRKALREYAEKFDFTVGERATEPTPDMQFRDENELNQYVIENSQNPTELAEIYINQEPTTQPLSTVERMIADYGVGKVTNKSFERFGDRNLKGLSMAKAYFNNQTGQSIDQVAKEMSDHYDIEITPQDIADFMVRFPNGEGTALKLVENEVASNAAAKFKELTGLNLNQEIAQKVIEQQFNKLSKAEQLIAQQDYESATQLEEAYWREYEQTDGFTKESPRAETKPNEQGERQREPKADISKEPIGEAKPKQENVEPKSPLETKYEQINQLRGEKVRKLAKEKLISDNFDGIVAQLMTKNKIKRQC